MGNNDIRGGAPISPKEPNFDPTMLEEEVLGVLEKLDLARESALELLPEVFAGLVAKRYPAGEVVDLFEVPGIHGHSRGATHAKVRRIIQPEVSLSEPEATRVPVECVCLKSDGSESKNVIRFHEPVLTQSYEIRARSEERPITPRDQLTNLLRDLALDQPGWRFENRDQLINFMRQFVTGEDDLVAIDPSLDATLFK